MSDSSDTSGHGLVAPIDVLGESLALLQEQLLGGDQQQEVLEVLAKLSAAVEDLEVAAEALTTLSGPIADWKHEPDVADARYRDLFNSAPDAYLATDRDGVVLEANRRATELLGTQLMSIVGRTVVSFVDKEHRPLVLNSLHSALRQRPGSISDIEVRMAPFGLPPFHASVRVAAAAPAPLAPELVRWVIRDTTLKIRVGQARTAPGPRPRPLIDGATVRDAYVRAKANSGLQAALARERATSDALRQADLLKNTLLLAVSHDLRSPSAAASAMAEILLEKHAVLRAGEIRRIAEGLALSTRQIGSILDNLLDAERIEAGQIAIRGVPTELTEIVVSSAATAGLTGDAVVLPSERVTARVDPGLTSRIFDNLLSNAARHARNGTPVRVTIANTADGLVLSIDNEGNPIPDEAKEAIFEAFWRHPAAPRGGLGLGLYLVRSFAEIQQGRAWVEDLPAGGCSFKVLLPVAGELSPTS